MLQLWYRRFSPINIFQISSQLNVKLQFQSPIAYIQTWKAFSSKLNFDRNTLIPWHYTQLLIQNNHSWVVTSNNERPLVELKNKKDQKKLERVTFWSKKVTTRTTINTSRHQRFPVSLIIRGNYLERVNVKR